MASIKPRKRGGTELNELDAEMRRSFSQKMGQIKRLKRDIHEEDPDSGVVYVSHIPHGFYEPQMKKFFSQFGNVKRLRLSRSKKSGRSKGYAYVEFEFSEVAKVVAETMHNYLMYRKLLKCFYVPKEKLHPDTFKGCFRHFKRPRRREIAAARNNQLLESDREHILKSQEKRVSSLQKKQKKLQSLGIDFKIEGLESELKRLKEADLPSKVTPASRKSVRQTPVTEPESPQPDERTSVASKKNVKSASKTKQPKVAVEKEVVSKVKSKSVEKAAGTRPAGRKTKTETVTPAQKLKKGAKSAKAVPKTKSVTSGKKKTKRKSL